MILPGTGRGTGEAGGGGSLQLTRPEVAAARKLRRTMSLTEVLLWERLRGSKLGMKFRRQHPIGPYVADFFCSLARLVVEIDGDAHNRADAPGRDAARDRFFNDNGLRVVRLAAVDILRDADAAASGVACVARPLHQPAAGPPPRSGED